MLLKYFEILLENTARRILRGQIATEDILLATLNDEYKKLERKFEFVKDMHTERMDIITIAFCDKVQYDGGDKKAVLDLVDPVKPRRDVRDYLRVILERLEKVQEDELAKADSIMATIKENFGTTDVDDEDIEDMVEKIVEFYRTAEDGKLPGNWVEMIHYGAREQDLLHIWKRLAIVVVCRTSSIISWI